MPYTAATTPTPSGSGAPYVLGGRIPNVVSQSSPSPPPMMSSSSFSVQENQNPPPVVPHDGLDQHNEPEEPSDCITRLREHDVLMGRGGGTNNYIGNVKFRKLVQQHKLRYLACPKVDKPKVAKEVVYIWRHQQNPPGRFLARKEEDNSEEGDDTEESGSGSAAHELVEAVVADDKDKKGGKMTKKSKSSKTATSDPTLVTTSRTGMGRVLWYDVGDKKANAKASQCLRERTPDVVPYLQQLRHEQDRTTEQGMMRIRQHQQQQENEQRAFQQQQQQKHNHGIAGPFLQHSGASKQEMQSFPNGGGSAPSRPPPHSLQSMMTVQYNMHGTYSPSTTTHDSRGRMTMRDPQNQRQPQPSHGLGPSQPHSSSSSMGIHPSLLSSEARSPPAVPYDSSTPSNHHHQQQLHTSYHGPDMYHQGPQGRHSFPHTNTQFRGSSENMMTASGDGGNGYMPVLNGDASSSGPPMPSGMSYPPSLNRQDDMYLDGHTGSRTVGHSHSSSTLEDGGAPRSMPHHHRHHHSPHPHPSHSNMTEVEYQQRLLILEQQRQLQEQQAQLQRMQEEQRMRQDYLQPTPGNMSRNSNVGKKEDENLGEFSRRVQPELNKVTGEATARRRASATNNSRQGSNLLPKVDSPVGETTSTIQVVSPPHSFPQQARHKDSSGHSSGTPPSSSPPPPMDAYHSQAPAATKEQGVDQLDPSYGNMTGVVSRSTSSSVSSSSSSLVSPMRRMRGSGNARSLLSRHPGIMSPNAQISEPPDVQRRADLLKVVLDTSKAKEPEPAGNHQGPEEANGEPQHVGIGNERNGNHENEILVKKQRKSSSTPHCDKTTPSSAATLFQNKSLLHSQQQEQQDAKALFRKRPIRSAMVTTHKHGVENNDTNNENPTVVGDQESGMNNSSSALPRRLSKDKAPGKPPKRSLSGTIRGVSVPERNPSNGMMSIASFESRTDAHRNEAGPILPRSTSSSDDDDDDEELVNDKEATLEDYQQRLERYIASNTYGPGNHSKKDQSLTPSGETMDDEETIVDEDDEDDDAQAHKDFYGDSADHLLQSPVGVTPASRRSVPPPLSTRAEKDQENDAPDSDLEDDWEQERDKRTSKCTTVGVSRTTSGRGTRKPSTPSTHYHSPYHRKSPHRTPSGTAARSGRGGVERHKSGMDASMMSLDAETTMSSKQGSTSFSTSLSIFSNWTPEDLNHSPNHHHAQQHHHGISHHAHSHGRLPPRTPGRSVSNQSHLSIMSELTDLSQNMDELYIQQHMREEQA